MALNNVSHFEQFSTADVLEISFLATQKFKSHGQITIFGPKLCADFDDKEFSA